MRTASLMGSLLIASAIDPQVEFSVWGFIILGVFFALSDLAELGGK